MQKNKYIILTEKLEIQVFYQTKMRKKLLTSKPLQDEIMNLII